LSFTRAGASSLPFSASKPAVIPVLFVFASAHAHTSLSSMLLSAHTWEHTSSLLVGVYPKTKKNKSAKRPMIHLEPKSFFASFILFVVGEPTGSGRQNLALPLYLRSSTYKTLRAMAQDESSKPRVIVSQQPLQHPTPLLPFQNNLTAPCPTTVPPPLPTTIPLRVTTPTDKEAHAYATHVGLLNNPRSSRSAYVEVVYVTICLFLLRQLNESP
jgi:hypothetical protein